MRKVSVSQFEGLRILDILAFAWQHCDIDMYVSENKTDKYPSRQWIWNLGKKSPFDKAHTLYSDTEKFQAFIDKITIKNNENIDNKRNKFQVLPFFFKIFEDTKFKSSKYLLFKLQRYTIGYITLTKAARRRDKTEIMKQINMSRKRN